MKLKTETAATEKAEGVSWDLNLLLKKERESKNIWGCHFLILPSNVLWRKFVKLDQGRLKLVYKSVSERMRRRNVVHLRRLRCLQSARLGGTAPPPSLLQSCSDPCKMSCFLTLRSWKDARGSSVEGVTDCEEKTETSLYSHFFSKLVQGQDLSLPPPPGRRLHESAAGWLSCVGGSLPTNIMSHKKMGCNVTLQMLILLIPVAFPSIIMELCWSHVFPARRTLMKSQEAALFKWLKPSSPFIFKIAWMIEVKALKITGWKVRLHPSGR